MNNLEKLKNKKVFVFDKDDTITLSNEIMDEEMRDLFCQLLAQKQVAVISGQKLDNLHRDITNVLECKDLFGNLMLLPTNGSAFLKYQNGEWKEILSRKLTNEQVKKIFDAFNKALAEYGHHVENPVGPIVENRITGVSFAALGIDADPVEKRKWDPDHKKREAIVKILAPMLPEFNVKIGGTTTIDVMDKSVNKATGMKDIAEHLGLSLDDFVYVGDALFPGGNDEVVMNIGVDTVDVCDENYPTQKTKDFLKNFLQ
ncbi:HAD-IIB family hydrolase [Candidatus Nomurabacteria bacterium]|nr:HAD-IIB family hydrolase [Candidatus Nomurabacteria bacterium]